MDFAVLTAELAEGNNAQMFGDSQKHTRLWNKEQKNQACIPCHQLCYGNSKCQQDSRADSSGLGC